MLCLPILQIKRRFFRLLCVAMRHKGLIMLCFCMCAVGISCTPPVDSGNGGTEKDDGNSLAASFNAAELKARRVCFLTGMDKADAGFVASEAVQRFITKQDKAAESALQSFGGYEGLAVYSPANKPIEEVYADFDRILTLAKVYRTEGSAFFQKPALAAAVNTLLRILHTDVYHQKQAEHTNWWHWEIGFPLKILDTLLLLDEAADIALRNALILASRYFQPDALYSGNNPTAIHPSGNPKRFSTGANRVDLVKLCVLRGILARDSAEIRTALAVLAPVWQTRSGSESGEARDGFYADGSFIQHSDIPYTGTYGVVLIGGIGELLYLIGAGENTAALPQIDGLYAHLFSAFEPLLYKGCMPDFVSGRSVSRENSWDAVNGQAALYALELLSKGATAPYAQRIQALIKRELQNSDILAGGIASAMHTSLFYHAALAHSAADTAVAVEPLPYLPKLYYFNEMERYFFRCQKYAIGLALHSKKTGNYETMNGENMQGWYTGDGMMYIYDRTDTYRYFWHEADLHYIPGTTEIVRNMDGIDAQRNGNKPATGKPSTGSPETQTVQMDFHNWNNTLSSSKTWTFISDGVQYSETAITGIGDVYHVIEHKQVFNTYGITVNGTHFNFRGGEHSVQALREFSIDGRYYTLDISQPAKLRCYRKNGRAYCSVTVELGVNPVNKSVSWTLKIV